MATAEDFVKRLHRNETVADAERFEDEKRKAIRQGMCELCAVETAHWTVLGLSGLHRLNLNMCRTCERRLNPPTRRVPRTDRFEPVRPVVKATRRGRKSRAKANARCSGCAEPFRARHGNTRYCSTACRQRAYRARSVELSPR